MPDSLATLALVFGGCCSNAITTERLTADNPNSGILITFFQFLVVSLFALPAQFTPSWSLRPRRVPLLPYLLQVALFFVLSTLNNAAFAYDIPMTVHIVFRSGGMIINMLLGRLLVQKRYTPKQVLSVLVVTIGIILTTLSASTPPSTPSTRPASLYAHGIAILALALLLSGLLGLAQDHVYARYVRPTEPRPPLAQPPWQENMFYIHALALPLFYFSRAHIASELASIGASPPLPLPYLALPRTYAYLLANTVTQLFCVVGVNRLTGRVSSLTVTLILTVRKAISLLLSVAVYGGTSNPAMWLGATLVFLGTIAYSTGARTRRDKKDET